MGVASWSLLSGPLYGSGPAGAAPRGRPGGWCSGFLPVWWGPGWLACLVLGVGDTPALVGCCGCCGRGGRLVGGCPLVGGGMLSGFWGSAPWLPDSSGAPGCGGSWVGVGGLVVNCIVDASILL